MGYDHDIAVFLLTERNHNASVAARNKLDGVIGDNPNLKTLVLQIIAEIRYVADTTGFGEFVLTYIETHKSKAATSPPLHEIAVDMLTKTESLQSLKSRQEESDAAKKSYDIGLHRHTMGLCLGDVLDLIKVFWAVNAPEVLITPICNVAFSILNGLNEDDRRQLIGMEGDRYGQATELVRQIVCARTDDDVTKASGQLWQPPEADASASFAWPTDDPAPQQIGSGGTLAIAAPAAAQ